MDIEYPCPPGSARQVTVHQSIVTSKQTCVEPRGYFPAASIGSTDARNEILGCFGRSHRRAQHDALEPFARRPSASPPGRVLLSGQRTTL
jgi:hypothetical protein